MKSTRMLGTASSLKASKGANDETSFFDGGVCGRSRQNAASTRDTTPATVNVARQRRFHRRTRLQRPERLPQPG